MVGRCPFHKGDRDNFYINPGKGIWNCFRGCGGGTLFDLHMRLLADVDNDWQIVDNNVSRNVTRTAPELRMLLERGFTPAMLADWSIVWDKTVRAICIPVYDLLGNYLSPIWRSIDPKDPAKYRYERGFNKSEVLFGAHKLASGTNMSSLPENKEKPWVYNKTFSKLASVTLVEGPLDAIWVQKAGIPAVAILGSSLSNAQVGILQQIAQREVTLAFDNDEAGAVAVKTALPLLRNAGFWVRKAQLPSRVKDIQELPLGEARKVVKSAPILLNSHGLNHPRYQRWLGREAV